MELSALTFLEDGSFVAVFENPHRAREDSISLVIIGPIGSFYLILSLV